MTLTWCKLHTDLLHDAKLMRGTRKGAKHLALLPWLLVWARAHDPTDAGRLLVGSAPAEPEDIAAAIPGVSAAQVRACIDGLRSLGVLVADPDGVQRFARWDGRSGRDSGKPSDAPQAVRERVRKHREKQRGNAPDETPGNAGNALRNAIDREEEIELEAEVEEELTRTPTGADADESTREVLATREARATALVGPLDEAGYVAAAWVALTDALPATGRRDLILEVLQRASRGVDCGTKYLVAMHNAIEPLGAPAASPAQLGFTVMQWLEKADTPDFKLFQGYMRRAHLAELPQARTPALRPSGRGQRETAGRDTAQIALDAALDVCESVDGVRPALSHAA